jgi:hypothetical protein
MVEELSRGFFCASWELPPHIVAGQKVESLFMQA